MEIEIISEEYNASDIYTAIKSNENITYDIKEKSPELRPIETSVLIAILGSATSIFSALVVSFINALKAIKIQELNLKHTANESEKDRALSIRTAEYERETEKLKILEHRKNLILEGKVEIVGNYKKSILRPDVQDDIDKLLNEGIEISEHVIAIPVKDIEGSSRKIINI